MDAAQIVLAGATGVVGALSGAVGALYARLLKEADRTQAKLDKLEAELNRVQDESLERALRAMEEQREMVTKWAAIASVLERAQDGRYRR